MHNELLHQGQSVFMLAGFGQVTQQLPKFDIDKHGNRLDKPLDPYGGPLSSVCTIHDTLIGSAVSCFAASLALLTLFVLQTVVLHKVMLHSVMLQTSFWDILHAELHVIPTYHCLTAASTGWNRFLNHSRARS